MPGRGRRWRRVAAVVALTAVLVTTAGPFLTFFGRAATGRTLDVLIYDFFNAPAGGFQDYWQLRNLNYGRESVVHNTYPYLFKYTPRPATDPGNFFLYGDCRMAITGQALPEMTIDAPVVLPHLGTTSVAGGFALVNLTMSFLTQVRWDALRAAGYEMPVWDINDGYAAELRGTVTMDALGAEKILGLTGNPNGWWAQNGQATQNAWSTWLDADANNRLDIYSGFRSSFTELFTALTLGTSGGLIVLNIEHVSWGVDALLSRWMYWGRARYLLDPPAGFLGFEGRYDQMTFRANLAATADVDVAMDVDYGLRAWATADGAGAIWVWQPALLDVIPSRPVPNPLSEFDPYAALAYPHLTPGSPYYGRDLYYEYTPTAWNLKAGESVMFILSTPVGIPLFFVPPSSGTFSASLRLGRSVPDVSGGYSVGTRVLRIVGPFAMGAPSVPLQGYPWIEFGPDVGGGAERRRP